MEIEREGNRRLEGPGRDGKVNHQSSQPIAEEEWPGLAGQQPAFAGLAEFSFEVKRTSQAAPSILGSLRPSLRRRTWASRGNLRTWLYQASMVSMKLSISRIRWRV